MAKRSYSSHFRSISSTLYQFAISRPSSPWAWPHLPYWLPDSSKAHILFHSWHQSQPRASQSSSVVLHPSQTQLSQKPASAFPLVSSSFWGPAAPVQHNKHQCAPILTFACLCRLVQLVRSETFWKYVDCLEYLSGFHLRHWDHLQNSEGAWRLQSVACLLLCPYYQPLHLAERSCSTAASRFWSDLDRLAPSSSALMPKKPAIFVKLLLHWLGHFERCCKSPYSWTSTCS